MVSLIVFGNLLKRTGSEYLKVSFFMVRLNECRFYVCCYDYEYFTVFYGEKWTVIILEFRINLFLGNGSSLRRTGVYFMKSMTSVPSPCLSDSCKKYDVW